MASGQVLNCLQTLFNHEALCDISLLCQGEVLRAHKVVLMSHSRVLCAEILAAQDLPYLTINLDTLVGKQFDMKFNSSVVKKLFTFMYFNDFDRIYEMSTEELTDLYCTAQFLHIDAAVENVRKIAQSKGIDLMVLWHELSSSPIIIESEKEKQIFNDIFGNTNEERMLDESDSKQILQHSEEVSLEDSERLQVVKQVQSALNKGETDLASTNENTDDEDLVNGYCNSDQDVDITNKQQSVSSPKKKNVIDSELDIADAESPVNSSNVQNVSPSTKSPNPQSEESSDTAKKGKPRLTSKDAQQTKLKSATLLKEQLKVNIEESSGKRPFDEHKTQDGKYSCPDCKFMCEKYVRFLKHMTSHRGDRPYHCTVCDKTFTKSKYMQSHMRTHSDERPYKCSVCEAAFKDSKHLNRHKKVHSAEKTVECTEAGCSARFVDQGRLNKHVRFVHAQDKPYKCEQEGCAYAATTKNAMELHQFSHIPKSERSSVLCDICGKPLTGARSIKLHMLLHDGEEIHCTKCDYKSVFKGAVKSHMYRLHGEDMEGNKVDKPYKCDVCGFQAYFSTDYKFHMSKHTGVRPHKCPDCDFDTHDKDTLKKHRRSHTGETPFVCLICGQGFSNRSALARHKRSHTGEKPFKCEHCDATYADKKSLVAHGYKHTGTKPYMCHICPFNCIKKQVFVAHILNTHGDDQIPDDLRPKEGNKKYRPRNIAVRQQTALATRITPMEGSYNYEEEQHIAVSSIQRTSQVPILVSDYSEIPMESLHDGSTEQTENTYMFISHDQLPSTIAFTSSLQDHAIHSIQSNQSSLSHPSSIPPTISIPQASVHQLLPSSVVNLQSPPNPTHEVPTHVAQMQHSEFVPSTVHSVPDSTEHHSGDTDLAPLLQASGISVMEPGTMMDQDLLVYHDPNPPHLHQLSEHPDVNGTHTNNEMMDASHNILMPVFFPQ